MKLDLAALYSMSLALPATLQGRVRWVMSPETKEQIKEAAERAMPRPPGPAFELPEPTTRTDVLLQIPVKLVPGFEGIALEVEGVVGPEGKLW
jgi:hypothetical protein